MQYIRYTRNLFLRGVSVIFLQAFIVLYVQNSGLYGENGVLPVKNLLKNQSPVSGTKFENVFSLLWYAPTFGLSHEYMFDVFCLIGILVSFLGFLKQCFCNKIVYSIIWAIYISLYHVGQVFVSDLADELLCEIAFLCMLIAPLPFDRPKVIKKRSLRLHTSLESEPSDSITFWLVRWLLFRVSFSAGVAKMTSKSTSWYHLTAMSKYFETMPLPNVISWYAHYFPVSLLKTVTVLAEINDIFVPFMFLIPIRSVRKIAFYIQVFMQIGILASGNYSYYNLLYIVLCLSLLDDFTFYRELALTRTRQWMSSVFTKLMAFNAITLLVAIFLMMYDFRLTPAHTPEYKITFTPNEFSSILKTYLPYISHFALASFIFECLKSLYASLPFASNTYGSLGTMIKSTMYICVCLGLFSLSTVPLSALHPSVNNTAAKDVILLYNTLTPFKLSNHYVPHQELLSPESRKEIIIQGANDIKGPWYEYQFLFKPGNVNATPPIIVPYKPLLDRQLFFAAHTLPNQNPWLYGLIYRLLNNQKEVLSLLNTNQNPFVKKPPKFIKVALYQYKFASPPQRKRGIWWNRQLIMPDYLQAMDKNSQVLLDTLKTHKILLNRTPLPVNPYVKQILDLFRSLLLAVDPRILMFTFLVAGFVFILIPSGSSALSI